MRNFKNNYKRRYKNNHDRPYKNNGSNNRVNGDFVISNDFRRKKTSRNNQNSFKLIEKYTELAKEALSRGDKILSENYFQHADHFQRISDKQNLDKLDRKQSDQNNKVNEFSNLNSTNDNTSN
tara:strand:+ start:371 stop:739 length:369 start_codon:yes stop_codon:yes gene_type:complete